MSERFAGVLTDIDGTLLYKDLETKKSVITPRVMGAIAAVQALEIPVMPVTGRPLELMHKVTAKVPFRDLGTLSNGASIYDFGRQEYLEHHCLRGDVVRAVVMAIRQHSTKVSFGPDFNTQEAIAAIHAASELPEAPSVFADFLRADEAKITEVLVRLQADHDMDLHFMEGSTGERCVQAVLPGLSKKSGVQNMLRHAGLEGKRLAAFGDNYNDLAMFAALGDDGVAVAMGDAPDEVKDAADYVVPPASQDGLAIGLEKYVLSQY